MGNTTQSLQYIYTVSRNNIRSQVKHITYDLDCEKDIDLKLRSRLNQEFLTPLLAITSKVSDYLLF
uniref:Uncharacterized protein n=1 Tax=viral metagenome TaxID=1070528 RepID=A0A6M3JEL4_9ZZZZ